MLDASAPQGLCRTCLLLGSLAAEPDPEGEAGAANPAGADGPLRLFGDYELLGEVGRGGMGVVYRARQRSLGRLVAVKLLLLGRFAGADAEARFQREAEAAARLRHPHVVPVFEVGRHEDQPFFSMEFVTGRDLDSLVREHPLAPVEAARLVERIARAVQHAHEHGIVHRDLKPSNILVDELGEPRVTDFGLAKLAEGGPELTTTGQVLGTPGFLAPEQAGSGDGQQITPLADVYSLGAILYHALTGRAPFAGASVAETLRQIADHEPPSPRVLNPAIPRDLETITLRCLAKEAARRYPDAAELAEELGRFQRGEPIRARPLAPAERTWRWARRHPAAALALVLGFILAVGGPLMAWRINLLRLQAESLAAENRHHLVAAQVEAGRRLAEANAVAEALPWFANALALEAGNPERERVHRLRLGTMRAQLAPLRQLWEADGPVRELWFSRDGRQVIAWVDNDRGVPALRAWSVETGRPEALPPRPANAHDALAVSQDVSAMILPAPHGALLFRRVGTNVTTIPLPLPESATVAAFSPAGNVAAVAGNGGQVAVFRTATGEPVGEPWHCGGPVNELVVDPREQRVAVRYAERQLVVRQFATGRTSRNMGRFHAVAAVAFSDVLDELLIASRDGQADIWTVFSTTRKFELRADTELTAAAWASRHRVVATAGRDGRVRVWDAATRLDLVPALAHATNVTRIAFSPDGRHLATASANRLLRLWNLGRDARASAGNAPLPTDGHWQVELGTDRAARLHWNGELISPPLRHPDAESVRFSREGRHVVTVAVDKQEQFWPITTETRSVADLLVEAELLAARRLSADGRPESLTSAELLARWRQLHP